MSLTAILFLVIVFTGFTLCLFKRPYYGLLTYIFIYFICPNPAINWWAKSIPEMRWSLLAAVVLIIGVSINKKELNEVNLREIKAGSWLIVFLIISIIISFYAVNQDHSFTRCYDFFRYILVFYLMIKCIKTEKDLFGVVLLLLFCGFLLGYFAYGQPRHGGRLEGIGTPDTANANGLALLLGCILPLGFPIFLYNKKVLKYCSAFFIAFIINGIILCNSRGAILSIIAGFISILAVVRGGVGLRRKVIVVGIIGLCSFAYLADDQFWERFNTIAESSEKDRGSGRLDIWKSGIVIVKDYPMGAGGDGFQILSPLYIADNLLTGGVRSSHNTYLQILVEQSFLGLSVYLLFFVQLFLDLRSSRKILFLAKDRVDDSADFTRRFMFLYTLNIAVSSALVCHMVGAFLGNRLYYEFVYYLAALAESVKLFSVQLNHQVQAAIIEKKIPD